MQTTIIDTKGKLSLALSAETEVEKLQLRQLFAGQIDVVQLDKTQVLDKTMSDTVVITQKPING